MIIIRNGRIPIPAKNQKAQMKLATGADIPQVAVGTYRLKGEDAERVVYDAVCIGYRHIDTAAVYRNEEAVGRAIQRVIAEGIVTRSELFVTTKVSPKQMGYDKTVDAISQSLAKLSLEYIDLMLLHWPGTAGKKADSPLNASNRVGSMQALAESHHAGVLKAIGVSNFLEVHFQGLETFPIHVNQVEFHPLQWAPALHGLATFCRSRHMLMAAYSSLGEGALLDATAYPELQVVASRLHCSIAQVLLAWTCHHGWIVMPKASSKARLLENFQLVDLTDADVAAMNQLVERTGAHKFCWDPSTIA
ncbi:Aste57867_18836 [Aphanomyces stellatus]|uniref:Aste57867_18836 protein n=1 Tax=Aphanomyces stellatus TaxID=120398 RepID=A0A485LBG0_9STRA|nr:hypothetical protein As57867_018772 [Aphanomyces stellatus]VFT95570.1 Aste57867_18836 [Aphanomyces stellatus]